MWTRLYWVNGPWPGKLAISARPRGGEWLEDDLVSWQQEGIKSVLSLLTKEEEQDLDLKREAAVTKARGMHFLSFPIVDRNVPTSQSAVVGVIEKIDENLSAERNVVD